MSRRAALATLAVLGALCVALVAWEVSAGAFSARPGAVQEACSATPPSFGTGLDATIQRVVQAGLYAAACRLGTTREELVLSLAPSSTGEQPRWSKAQIEAAVRQGMLAAIGNAETAGDIPSWIADPLRTVVEQAPVGWLVDNGRSLGGILSGLGDLYSMLKGLFSSG